MKCPLSAPPKSAKSRLPRLAIVSMSQKMGVFAKEKAKTLPKVSSTPKTKGKQVAAKYLTTPRNKKILPNPDSFRSVQNPKPSTLAVPKHPSVVKALVFHSPKKAINLKTSVELRTPLTKRYQGMRKLEITSQRKRVLGYSSKPAKPLGQDSQKSLPLHSTTREKVPNKEKSKTKILPQLHSHNDKETKSLRPGKCKNKGNLHDCTAETILKYGDDTEGHLAADLVKEASYPASEVDSTSKEGSKGDFNTLKQSEQTSMGENDAPRSQALDKEDDSSEGNGSENVKESSENDEQDSNDTVDEFEPSEGATCEGQMTEYDDKENASAFDENR